MTTLWLYLHFPALQLDSLFQQAGAADPATVSSAAGITAQVPPLCLLDSADLVVKQLNHAAAALGIQTGMTLSMASALSHDLQVLPYQAAQEQMYLQQIAALLYQSCADIALDPPCALWLQIAPMLALHGGLSAYLSLLTQQLDLLQLRVQMALAHSAAAAQLLCFSQPGLLCELPHLIEQALQACPLQNSQLQQSASGRKILQQLQSMGIVTLGQLLKIPRAELSRRFSADLISLLDQLAGHRPTVRQFYQPPEQFCQSLELLYQLEQSQQLQAPLGYLLKLLQHYLQQRDQHCYQLHLKLELRDHPPIQLSLQSARGEYQQARWLQLFQLKLQQLKLPAPILKMQLRAEQTTAREGDNLSLFGGRSQHSTSNTVHSAAEDQAEVQVCTAEILGLRSLLAAKLGEARVQQPGCLADHRPELANTYHTLELASGVGSSPQQKPGPSPHSPAFKSAQSGPVLPLRPGFLLPAPIPLRMQLQLQPGLERIQTGWWDQQAIQRDYYIGRNSQGQWCWVFKNDQGWYLHGYFA